MRLAKHFSIFTRLINSIIQEHGCQILFVMCDNDFIEISFLVSKSHNFVIMYAKLL